MSKVALITGASRGIGAATAKKLAAEGYAVAVNYVGNKDKADSVVADIVKAGGKAISIQADMGKEDDILHMFETLDKELGPVTALVNNAALNRTHASGMVEEMTLEVLEAVYRVNVFGVFIACREAVKRMKQAGGGGIVNVSSEAGKFGGNRMTHYASSKAAINTMTIGFAREVAPHNIRVNVVSPGVIDTDAHATATPERLAGLKASIPMGRMGSPEEVAEAIYWLLSDSSSYVSGTILSVHGAR
jgi:NAD(P)-dependent dehydrogenase (short-subunit alcohol dehydrogenase family)